MDNLGETGKFLEIYNLPKLNQKEAEILNRATTTSEIEEVIKNLPAYKSPGPEGLRRRILPTIQRTKTYPSETIPNNSRIGKTKLFFRTPVLF